MKTFSEKLNFSSKNNLENSIEIDFRKDVNVYETLCAYCANNSVDLSNVSDEEFSGAVEVIETYKKGNGYFENESFFMSIDA